MTQRMLPLYEGKMLHHYDHRWATQDEGGARDAVDTEKADASFAPAPRYWVREELVHDRLANRGKVNWLAGWRNISNTTNERTLIASLFPIAGVGHSVPIILGQFDQHLLVANLSSFIADYVVRQKLGGTNVTFNYFQQFPVPGHDVLEAMSAWGGRISTADWLGARVLELTYTADDMRPFAMDLGDPDEPFVWDPERRFLLRCELDAAFFHLYGIERDDVDYIMDTFPIVRSKDVAAHGEFSTKRVILQVFDAMQRAIDTGEPYRTILDPPPGEGPRHPAKESAR